MKTSLFFVPLLIGATTSTSSLGKPPEPPVPVVQRAEPWPAPPEFATDNQRLYGPAKQSEALVPPDVVASTMARFRAGYGSPAAPRIVIYVNRALIDTAPGRQVTVQTERYEQTNDTLKTSGTSTYKAGATVAAPTLADRQTVREIERLFGRVFRSADAKLADQKTAVDLFADKPGQILVGASAARQREALSAVADIAIEVLISSRVLTLPGLSEDQSYTVPDLQVTAIRLKDSAIVGQASASDVLGKELGVVPAAKIFSVSEITEATAIALMQDMLVGVN